MKTQKLLDKHPYPKFEHHGNLNITAPCLVLLAVAIVLLRRRQTTF